MKNLIIFILIIIIAVIGYLFGYPAYQLKQAENVVRHHLKNANITHIINANVTNDENISDKLLGFTKNNFINFETNNQYPLLKINVIIKNINIEPFDTTLPFLIDNSKKLQKDYFCQKIIDKFKNEPNTIKQAFINVLEQDNVQFEITIFKENGSIISQYNHKVVDCLGLWATNTI